MKRDLFSLAYDVRMKAGESDTAEVMLYGEIVEDSPFKWSEEDKSAADFDKAIKKAQKEGATKLLLRINSPGGICTQGVAMRSILANAGFEQIDIRIEGLCASAATDIATLPGAHVAIAEGSEYMIHNPWCYAMGDAQKLEHEAGRLRNIEKVSRGFYMKRTGQAEERIKEWMDAETWFTAQEAVQYGFADEVISAEAQSGSPAAACVSERVMMTMQRLYRAVPGQIVREDRRVSNEEPAEEDGESTENTTTSEEEEERMEIKDITQEQLREGNAGLYELVMRAGAQAERERMQEIDELTPAGYEAMAKKAKAEGTSAMEYCKMIVKAQREKGESYMAARQKETAQAERIAGGACENGEEAENELKAYAKEMGRFAEECRRESMGGMY